MRWRECLSVATWGLALALSCAASPAWARDEGTASDLTASDAPHNAKLNDPESLPVAPFEPQPELAAPPADLNDDPVAATEQATEEELPGQLGIVVGVPFYDSPLVSGDMVVDVRWGYAFDWFVPYVAGGFRQGRMLQFVAPEEYWREKLEAYYLTLGARAVWEVSPAIQLYAGGAGDLAFWGITTDTREICHEDWYPDFWGCHEKQDWKPGAVAKGVAGLIWKPEPSMAIEVNVEQGLAFASKALTSDVWYWAPTVGFAWHY